MALKISLGTPECITQRTLEIRVSLIFHWGLPWTSSNWEPYIFTGKDSLHLRLHPGSRWRKRMWVWAAVPLQSRGIMARLLGLSLMLQSCRAPCSLGTPLAGRVGTALTRGGSQPLTHWCRYQRLACCLNWEQVWRAFLTFL